MVLARLHAHGAEVRIHAEDGDRQAIHCGPPAGIPCIGQHQIARLVSLYPDDDSLRRIGEHTVLAPHPTPFPLPKPVLSEAEGFGEGRGHGGEVRDKKGAGEGIQVLVDLERAAVYQPIVAPGGDYYRLECSHPTVNEGQPSDVQSAFRQEAPDG